MPCSWRQQHPLAPAQEAPAVYRTVFLQAAPGRLTELVQLFRSLLPVYQKAGMPAPLLGRHTQGDKWDLLIVEPVGSLETWYSPANARPWDAAAGAGQTLAELRRRLDPLVAWREELFVAGPPVEEFQRRNASAGFYHLEIFQALAGKRDSLYRERLMEDDFSQRIGRPTISSSPGSAGLPGMPSRSATVVVSSCTTKRGNRRRIPLIMCVNLK